MSEKSLKSKALNGIIWNAVDKFALQAGHFVIGVVLARLLIPSDFGLIGVLSIFLAVSQTLIECGMGAGLIQKKTRTDVDFSTVFVFNFAVSILIYGILFYLAPLIANFYKMPRLILITRVLSINIVINSFAIVQRSKLTIKIDFKTIAKVNLLSVIISGCIAIYFAYHGMGVWALVIQTIIRTAVSVVVFWFVTKWKLSIEFSTRSFRELFGFGSKILLAELYSEMLMNIYNIFIGKFYTASKLGFYTRAKGFADITAGTITSILQKVTYPVLASLQNNRNRMTDIFIRLQKTVIFFVFPSMTLLAVLADPFVRLILTEKWLPVVPLLQWMCFARMITATNAINMNILKAIGRSDLYLLTDLLKFPITAIAIVITIPIGIKAIVIGQVCTTFCSFFINAYFPGKHFGYGAWRQMKNIFPVFIASVIMSIFTLLTKRFVGILWLKLFLSGGVGIIVYSLTTRILGIKEIHEVIELMKIIKNKTALKLS